MAREISTALNWLSNGHAVAVAIVAQTWGSAPRRAGSLMIVREDGVFEGSVSGGCVEGAVITEAEALLTQTAYSHKELSFAVASEQAWEVGLACGGEIKIWLFSFGDSDAEALHAALDLQSDNRACEMVFSSRNHPLQVNPLEKLPPKAVPKKHDDTFTVPLIPGIRVDIVGAVHIAQHLAAMARECEFQVRIIDPREAFLDNRSFHGAELSSDWPDDFFRDHPATSGTAVVTLTHDPKLDDAALTHVINSDAFYIGCLGSHKTHAARLERLTAAGMDTKALKRLCAPVGLDIGAATPAEIAASILAEIIQTARQQS